MKPEEVAIAAVDCSVFVRPTDPGLTFAELIEIGKRLGLEEGELKDAIQNAEKEDKIQQFWNKSYFVPTRRPLWCDFHFREDPDFRKVDAFDFVRKQLEGIARTTGCESRTNSTFSVSRKRDCHWLSSQ